jgi:hypothetical protein
MKIEINYRVDMPLTAKTWFAKMTQTDAQLVQSTCQKWLNEFCEHSVSPKSGLWQLANMKDGKNLGKSSKSKSHPDNTVLSSLSGICDKLTRGDLTAKQLEHLEQICSIMEQVDEKIKDGTIKNWGAGSIDTFKFNKVSNLKDKMSNGLIDQLFEEESA